MRQTAKDRDAAVRNMTKLGITAYDQARLLRLGATLQRLAEAQCNGDWPADNGERRTIECGCTTQRLILKRGAGSMPSLKHEVVVRVGDGCGTFWAPSVLRKTRGYLCPDCCATADAKAIAASYGLQAIIQGDPRGAVLQLAAGDATREDIDSGRARLEYVR